MYSEAVVAELRAQRNAALDMLANANGTVVELQQVIAELKALVTKLEKPSN